MFVSDLASRQETRRSMNVRVNARRIVIVLREGVGIHSCVCVCVFIAVDDPVIVGELAFRSGYVIVRDATQSAFPAVSDTDDIRFQHAIQISGSAVHHDDRTTSSVCRRTGLIGIIPVV